MYSESDLVRIARRENNTKRSYLVVNRLQGKHIPVKPSDAFEMFKELADTLRGAYVGERLLLVGFAETATAIGAAVAVELGTKYIQTTREVIPGVDYIFFSEEHSHATEQKLVKDDMDACMGEIDRIVFVEDEVTTGKTILNIIAMLEKLYLGAVQYSVASLLNGMDEKALKLYAERGIKLHYLVKTNHDAYSAVAEKFAGDGTYVACDTGAFAGAESSAVATREVQLDAEGCAVATKAVQLGAEANVVTGAAHSGAEANVVTGAAHSGAEANTVATGEVQLRAGVGMTVAIETEPGAEVGVSDVQDVRLDTDARAADAKRLPLSVTELTMGGAMNARRLVDTMEYREACDTLWGQIEGTLSKELNGRVLVLGTEEFMYPALYVARKIEQKGVEVRNHATTRSPIAVSTEAEYPLHVRYELRSLYDKDRVTFVYDIDTYDAVLVITDARNEQQEGLNSLINALKKKNDKIFCIRWC